MVNAVIDEEMKTIHALTQKTLTPEQWEKQKNSS
jgi:stress-induced morphogen